MGDTINDKILFFITMEKSNQEIADELKISKKYVEKLVKKLLVQFKVKSRVGLVREYLREKRANC